MTAFGEAGKVYSGFGRRKEEKTMVSCLSL